MGAGAGKLVLPANNFGLLASGIPDTIQKFVKLLENVVLSKIF